MSKNYTQLSLEQRYQIEAFVKAGMKQNWIASQMGVHSSTICRELKRNTACRGQTAGSYVASNAQRRTDLRHHQKPKYLKFTDELKQQAVARLREDKWSPELISAAEHGQVSHETIYRWIWACKHSNRQADRPYRQIHEHLKHGRRRHKRGNTKDNRGIIHGRISIEQRPAIVSQRTRPGDIEVDLMMGKNHQGAVLVMTDRTTLHTRLRKLASKNSQVIAQRMKKCLGKGPYRIHTLTFDNDQAFTEHKSVGEALGAGTYFTRPYTSQDKGTVENRIGVLRRFLPKKTDLSHLSHAQLHVIEKKLNNRPVRKYNYLTPNQVLREKIALIS